MLRPYWISTRGLSLTRRGGVKFEHSEVEIVRNRCRLYHNLSGPSENAALTQCSGGNYAYLTYFNCVEADPLRVEKSRIVVFNWRNALVSVGEHSS